MVRPTANLVRPNLRKVATGGLALLIVLDLADDAHRLRRQFARAASDWWVYVGRRESKQTRRAAMGYLARRASRWHSD